MSLAHVRQTWLERWWPLLVILCGLLFVAIILTYNPHAA